MTTPSKAAPLATAQTSNNGAGRNAGLDLAAIRHAATFGNVVSVLMRTPRHRHSFLADLEWLVLPALATNQYAISEARNETGSTMTAAVVMWAEVSEDVDRRLSESPANRVVLKPEEWKSGSIPWLVEAVGEPRAVGMLARALIEKRFSTTGLKSYGTTADGKLAVKNLRKPADKIVPDIAAEG